MTEQGLAGEFGQVDAQRQIRTGGRAWFISHFFPYIPFRVMTIGSGTGQLIAKVPRLDTRSLH
jgi:hypothetical protein